jgi:hypothetical protein
MKPASRYQELARIIHQPLPHEGMAVRSRLEDLGLASPSPANISWIEAIWHSKVYIKSKNISIRTDAD